MSRFSPRRRAAARLLALLAALLVALPALAQQHAHGQVWVQQENGPAILTDRCAAPQPTAEELRAMDAARGSDALARWTGAELVVPVAYHVLRSGNGRLGVIPEARLDAQTDSLNRQFERTGIRFVTVSVDSPRNDDWYRNVDLGGPLEGEVKRALAIDPARVLNLYFANIGALGWCYFPSNFPEDSALHGCFMATGTEPGGNAAPYNGGDTATHEIGHYFGLFHTFAEDDLGCEGPGDRVDDTPAEATPNFSGCNLMRDTCPDQPGFDPVTNFMNYSTDDCLNDFTPGQIARMFEQVAAFRPTLLDGQTAGLGLSRTTLDFGEIFVGQQAALPVFVANFDAAEGASYTIQGASVDGAGYGLDFEDGPVTLAPGERVEVEITFAPTDGGDVPGTLTLITDDPERPTIEVALSASGSLAPAASLNPGEVTLTLEEGTVGEAGVVLSNLGASALTFAFATPSASSFVTEVFPAEGAILPSTNGRVRLTLDAGPLAPDTYEETLTIATNDPVLPEIELPVELTVTKAVTTETRDQPLAFALAGNFPNPYAARTTIRFTLAEAAPTTLVVYDAAGNEVHRLVDGALRAGAHAVPFDATGLSSGAYFYRLVSGSKRATGSMVLLR